MLYPLSYEGWACSKSGDKPTVGRVPVARHLWPLRPRLVLMCPSRSTGLARSMVSGDNRNA